MSCNRCGCSTNPCCCNKAAQQIVGPPGPMGFTGPQGPTGPPGPVGPQGNSSSFETGVFTRSALQGNGIQNIPTTKMVKLAFFNGSLGIPQTNGTSGSFGKDDGSAADCVSAGSSYQDRSIFVQNIVPGLPSMSGKITAINANSFDITWTMTGAGVDVTVQWHAITI